MSNESKETIADIVAALRAIAYIQTAESPSSVLSFANRIEAAHKREREAGAEVAQICGEIGEMVGREAHCKEVIDCNHLGNAAEMRKTLIKVRSAICHFARYQCQSLSWEKSNIQANCCDVLCSWRDLCDAKTAINAALSAPPRNCDIYLTKKEQDAAYKKYREYVIMSNSNPYIAEDEMMSKEKWLCAEAKGKAK